MEIEREPINGRTYFVFGGVGCKLIVGGVLQLGLYTEINKWVIATGKRFRVEIVKLTIAVGGSSGIINQSRNENRGKSAY